jgi:hypothetical protein
LALEADNTSKVVIQALALLLPVVVVTEVTTTATEVMLELVEQDTQLAAGVVARVQMKALVKQVELVRKIMVELAVHLEVKSTLEVGEVAQVGMPTFTTVVLVCPQASREQV